MAGEPLVEERVVGREQVADVAIAEQDARHERLDLYGHVLSQLVVERGKQVRIGHPFPELVQVQPSEREVAHQTRRTLVVQHPERLGLERLRRMEFACGGEVEQRLVWSLTPQEEREPRGQFEIAQGERSTIPSVHISGVPPILRSSDRAEQELGADEDRSNHLFDASVEILLPSAIEVRHEGIDVFLSYGPAECATGQVLGDAPGAGLLLICFFYLWTTDEDAPAARRLRNRGRSEAG